MLSFCTFVGGLIISCAIGVKTSQSTGCLCVGITIVLTGIAYRIENGR